MYEQELQLVQFAVKIRFTLFFSLDLLAMAFPWQVCRYVFTMDVNSEYIYLFFLFFFQRVLSLVLLTG